MASGTDGESSRSIFEWKIENISHCWWLKKSEKIVSPHFVVNILGGSIWYLSLHPLGNTDKSISLYLNREKSRLELEVIEVYYKLVFLGKDRSILTEKTSPKSSFKENETQGFSMFEDRETVFVSSREIFLPEDTLTVQCTLWSHQYIPFQFQRAIKSGPEYIYARTVVSVNRRHFEWKIENITSFEFEHKKRYDDNLIEFDIIFNKKRIDELTLDAISFDDRLKYFSCNVSIIDSEGKRENCGIREYSVRDLKMTTLSFELPFSEMSIDNKGRYFPGDALSFEFIFTTVHWVEIFVKF